MHFRFIASLINTFSISAFSISTFSISALWSAQPLGYEDYNYSFVHVGMGYNQQHQGIESIDGNAYYINGAYQVSTSPVILHAGYAYNQTNRNELPEDTAMTSTSYFAGASLLFQSSDRLHVLPSVASGQLRSHITEGRQGSTTQIAVYSAAITARYHLEKGLWLYSGLTHQQYNEDSDSKPNFFTAGAEYQVSRDWGFGIGYRGNSDQYTTQFFVKWFL